MIKKIRLLVWGLVALLIVGKAFNLVNLSWGMVLIPVAILIAEILLLPIIAWFYLKVELSVTRMLFQKAYYRFIHNALSNTKEDAEREEVKDKEERSTQGA